jgi:hypothetical protein
MFIEIYNNIVENMLPCIGNEIKNVILKGTWQ